MISCLRKWLLPLALAASSAALGAPSDGYSFENSQAFLKQYCQACHQGKSPAGGFHVQRVESPASLQPDAQKRTALARRIKNGEMPPKLAPAPALDHREQFPQWVDAAPRTEACAAARA